MTTGRVRRIAVIGFGPKGLFALDHLAREAEAAEVGLRVAIFEPHPVVGAGPVYDPRQPRFLRMNFASGRVDLSQVAGTDFPSFVEWAAAHDPRAADPEGFAPRATVGAYLHAAARETLERLRRWAIVEVHPVAVSRVRRLDPDWLIEGADGRRVTADEVLLATGHASCAPGPAGRPRADARVFPVACELTPERIPPGATVAVRGMGLTALDAVVTFGHRAPAARPARLLLYSRSGRLMLPRLTPAARAPDAGFLLAPTRQRLEEAASVREFIRVLVEGASDLLAVMGRHRHAAASVLHVIMTGARRSTRPPLPQTALRRSLAIARGSRCWDAERALAETWRLVFPTVVAWHARHPFTRRERSTFRRLCRELERLSFGPPADVAEALLRGIDDGWIDLSVAFDPEVRRRKSGWELRSRGHRREADRLIDAVLAGPGVAPCPHPLFRSLLHAGHLRLREGWTGVQVTDDATAIGIDGCPTAGLAVIGRPTEGAVLGNDTLDRDRHRHAARWARRVAAGGVVRPRLQPS